MSLKDLDLKSGYDSGFDNLVNDFYNPVLSESISYKRIAGFFSSASLSVAARGISKLINNNGTMELLVSPRLTNEDIEVIKSVANNEIDYISTLMLKELDDLETTLQKNRIKALGWMLQTGKLKIKIAAVYNNAGRLMTETEINESGLFHIKVGVLEDKEGNILTFSGSINETASAWTRNVEEFKVFRNWNIGEAESAQIDINKFENYWNNKSEKVKIFELPNAVKTKLVKKLPQSFESIEYKIIKAEEQTKNNIELDFEPFEYQINALNIWKREKRSIFEMATGTGKTKTAELCIADLLNNTSDKMAIIISTPQNTLSRQWFDELKNSGIIIDKYVFADGTDPKWKDKLENYLLDMTINAPMETNYLFIFTTFSTSSDDKFLHLIKEYDKKIKYFFIGDEMHGLGAPKTKNALLNTYDYRLGLSATPDRWHDEKGTNILNEFFANNDIDNKFTFSLHDALTTINPLTGKTYLCPYMYIPRFTTLTEEELDKYLKLTKSIINKLHRAHNDDEVYKQVEALTNLRADIHKSACNKIDELSKLLDEIKDPSNMIIFCSPQLIDQVEVLVRRKNIVARRFTGEEGTKKEKRYNGLSEREHIIKAFKDGDFQVLIAMKCLDEGIDIPTAEKGIILSSSTNPKEYVQRIGRIIRRSKNKDIAYIYDFIVEPNSKLMNEYSDVEARIYEKEVDRIKEIANNAKNKLDIIEEIYERM